MGKTCYQIWIVLTRVYIVDCGRIVMEKTAKLRFNVFLQLRWFRSVIIRLYARIRTFKLVKLQESYFKLRSTRTSLLFHRWLGSPSSHGKCDTVFSDKSVTAIEQDNKLCIILTFWHPKCRMTRIQIITGHPITAKPIPNDRELSAITIVRR